MERSGCGAEVELKSLPISAALRRTAARYGWNPDEVAAAGGEDYCLLATVRAGEFGRISASFRRAFGRPLSAVGRITGAAGELAWLRGGRPARLESRGFDHFA